MYHHRGKDILYIIMMKKEYTIMIFIILTASFCSKEGVPVSQCSVDSMFQFQIFSIKNKIKCFEHVPDTINVLRIL